MSEDDIRNFLNRQNPAPETALPKIRVTPRTRPTAKKADTYKNFSATHLMCPRCRQAMPVKEKLLLFLPDGQLFDYLCTRCGTSVGTKKV